MKQVSDQMAKLALVSVVALVIALGLGCCECDDDDSASIENVQTIENVVTIKNVENIENLGGPISGKADAWLVLHDKNKVTVDADGNIVGCELESALETVAYLPECLHVEEGETLGFINFSGTDVIINHDSTLNAPNPFSLASGEEALFQVSVRDRAVDLEITSDAGPGDHGGPDMIVAP